MVVVLDIRSNVGAVRTMRRESHPHLQEKSCRNFSRNPTELLGVGGWDRSLHFDVIERYLIAM